jgi:hypothetical protein
MSESTGILLLNAEDNDESGLTITEEGSNNFSITTGAALHGTYGYNFAFDGTNNELHATKSFTAGTDIYVRCYFYIPSAFSMNANNLAVLILRDSSNSRYLCYLQFSFSGTTLKANRFYYRTNAGTAYISLTGDISRDTLHFVEMRYKSGNSDGVAECWLDDTSIASATGLANDTYQAGYVRIGNTDPGVPTSGSTFYVDDVKVDSSPIGAYADLSGGNSYYYQQQQM